jgi:hypothetical protein
MTVDEIRTMKMGTSEIHPPQSIPVLHLPATSASSTQQFHYHIKTDQTQMQEAESNSHMEHAEDRLYSSVRHQYTSLPQTHPREAVSVAADDSTET